MPACGFNIFQSWPVGVEMTSPPRGRPPAQNITELQQQTLDEIELFINRRGFPPTIKELAEILGISHASAHERVCRLVRKGYVSREPRKARGITVTQKTP